MDDFGFKHGTIAQKVGKSREYVSNTVRILNLPQVMIDALKEGKISEGHTRPLLMLIDRPEEQMTVFREILLRRMSVREAELVARHTALERSRIKVDKLYLETREIEDKMTESLGTRVMIERKLPGDGGKLTIAFFSNDDLKNILLRLQVENENADKGGLDVNLMQTAKVENDTIENQPAVDDRSKEEIEKADNTESDEDLYSIKNFSI